MQIDCMRGSWRRLRWGWFAVVAQNPGGATIIVR